MGKLDIWGGDSPQEMSLDLHPSNALKEKYYHTAKNASASRTFCDFSEIAK